MRRFFFALLLGLIPAGARAQNIICNPNYEPPFALGGSVFGFYSAQWQAFFGSKVDINGGIACNLTVNGNLALGTPLPPSSGGTGVNNGSNDLTVLLPVTFSGSPTYSTTLAFSGNTDLTFPATTDTVTTLAATQTLTNKTLSSPVLTGTMTGNGNIATTSTTASTSDATGAIVTQGGIGAAGAINAGGAIAAGATGFAGLGNGITVMPAGGATTLANLPAVAQRVVSVADFGAKCDAATDDSAAFTAALAKGSAMVPPGATCVIDNTVTLAPNAVLEMPANSTVTWMGSSGGTMFETSQTAITSGASIVGIGGNATLNPNGLAGTVIRIDSGSGDVIRNLTIPDNLAANGVVLDLHADIGSAPAGNLIGLTVQNLLVSGQTGTCIKFTGSGGGTPTVVVTDNNFYNITCTDVTFRDIDFVQDADTNRFYGLYGQLDANNARGFVLGSANTTAVEGVYENACYGCAIDTFAGFTGRVGIEFGYSPNNTFEDFVQSPVAEGGVFTYDVAGQPEYIRYINAGSGSSESYMRIYEGNVSTVTAPLVSVTGCTGLGTGSCTLQAANSASDGVIELAPAGTPAASGVVLLTFPITAQSINCTSQALDGTGTWISPTFSAAGNTNTSEYLKWYAGAALTAGDIYFLHYHCTFASTGWQ